MDDRDRHEDPEGEKSESNVVRFPRDWLGPRDQLSPFGPDARRPDPPQQRAQDSGPPLSANDFWGEDSAAMHAPVEAPDERGEPRLPEVAAAIGSGGGRPVLRRCAAAVATLATACAVFIALQLQGTHASVPDAHGLATGGIGGVIFGFRLPLKLNLERPKGTGPRRVIPVAWRRRVSHPAGTGVASQPRPDPPAALTTMASGAASGTAFPGPMSRSTRAQAAAPPPAPTRTPTYVQASQPSASSGSGGGGDNPVVGSPTTPNYTPTNALSSASVSPGTAGSSAPVNRGPQG